MCSCELFITFIVVDGHVLDAPAVLNNEILCNAGKISHCTQFYFLMLPQSLMKYFALQVKLDTAYNFYFLMLPKPLTNEILCKTGKSSHCTQFSRFAFVIICDIAIVCFRLIEQCAVHGPMSRFDVKQYFGLVSCAFTNCCH